MNPTKPIEELGEVILVRELVTPERVIPKAIEFVHSGFLISGIPKS